MSWRKSEFVFAVVKEVCNSQRNNVELNVTWLLFWFLRSSSLIGIEILRAHFFSIGSPFTSKTAGSVRRRNFHFLASSNIIIRHKFAMPIFHLDARRVVHAGHKISKIVT
jgi:hypothetical protein